MFLHGCPGQQDRLFCLFELNKPPWPYEQSDQTRSTSYSLSLCNCCLENGKRLGRGWEILNFARYVGVFCFYRKGMLTQGLTLCTHCGHRFCSWPLSPSLGNQSDSRCLSNVRQLAPWTIRSRQLAPDLYTW